MAPLPEAGALGKPSPIVCWPPKHRVALLILVCARQLLQHRRVQGGMGALDICLVAV